MLEDPNVVPKTAILQSITSEASGYYSLIVTVASTFLGGSLLFLEKIAPARSKWSVWVLTLAWILLVAAIGCIARLRHHNLRSGKLALRGEYAEAEVIDGHTDTLSSLSQWFLIGGMVALIGIGVLNFNQIANNERKEKMNDDNHFGSDSTPLRESIPYGSLRPNAPAPVQQTPQQKAPPPTPPRK